ncbi:MAG: laminin B domain-containing protein, partial [Halomonas sp.]|uniref:laminin B domain-containing protein n=1 Tax=Halomonas sp. TaxID=1486246 RepID=UPI002870B226
MAAPGWLQDHDLTSVMAAIEADWPTGMRPCHPAVTARATWALEDMLAFVLPEGFETGRSRSSFWIRTTSGPYASLGVGTGPDAFPSDFQLVEANSLGNGFIAAPEARRVTLMGEPATLFVGRSQAGKGSRVQHVALLDRCLPDGSPVVVTLRADDAWLSANGGFEALLNRAWLFLPEGARACDPALLQTAVEVSEADAVEGIEPAEGGAPTARGKTAAAGSAPSAPGGEGPGGLAGEVFPVLDGDMSHWSVSAAEFEASAAEITAKPGGDGLTSYYVAPALARGDWSHVRALLLDKKSHGGSYYAEGHGSEGDIVLEGPAGRATYALPQHHSGEWRHFEIPLNEPGWRLSQGAESLADVLRSVTALRIRAEYGAGTDVSGLRNVSLVVSNQESPLETAEQLRAAGLQSMLDGDYETALDRLERSLALKHDEALAGRVERLRLFLEVRPDSAPTNQARGE